jgi:hypothetical protein
MPDETLPSQGGSYTRDAETGELAPAIPAEPPVDLAPVEE